MYKELVKICLLNLEVGSVIAGAVPGRTVKGRGHPTQHHKSFLSASSLCPRHAAAHTRHGLTSFRPYGFSFCRARKFSFTQMPKRESFLCLIPSLKSISKSLTALETYFSLEFPISSVLACRPLLPAIGIVRTLQQLPDLFLCIQSSIL